MVERAGHGYHSSWMSSRAVRHPAVLFPALIVTMLAGSVLLGSTVQYFAVDTSLLGLDSSTGAGVSIAGSLLAMVAVVGIMFLALGSGHGHGRDDYGDGGDDVPPPAPRDPFGESEPLWWPQFEQDLDTYLRQPAGHRSEPERLPTLR